jgi:hypothetical protein
MSRARTSMTRSWHWENVSGAVGLTSMLLGLALCALAIVGG